MNNEDIINFNGADINLAHEYHEARKMMGLKSTDLMLLNQTVSHIYLCIPMENGWHDAYLNLLSEMDMREAMLNNMRLDALVS